MRRVKVFGVPASDPVPVELGPRLEHPHRCAAGHRWQHTGPSAAACQIPTYDQVLGNLPIVTAAECPVCCGRTDLLTRELHAHYCNMCDGEWDHAGRCLDDLVVCCPWCFPKAAAEPIPGARRSAHFHFCPECGQNWRHAIACAAPLRVVLPECTGCQYPPHPDDPEPAEALSATALRVARALGDRARLFALPVGIAAMAVLSISVALKSYSGRWGSAVDHNHPMVEQRVETSAPVPAQPVLPPTEPTRDLAKPAEDSSFARQQFPARKAPVPAAPPVTAPAPDLAKPSVDSSVPRRDVVSLPPATRTPAPQNEVRRAAPEPRPRIERSREPDLLPRPATPPLAPSPVGVQAPPATPSKPASSVARSELGPESAARSRETPSASSETATVATPVRVALPSVPGAPPFSGLSGSSGLDTSLDGHPRRVTR